MIGSIMDSLDESERKALLNALTKLDTWFRSQQKN